MLEKSKYLLSVENGKGEYVLLNSVNKKLIKVSPKYKMDLLNALHYPEISEITEFLSNNRYLVSDISAARDEVEALYSNICHSNKSLHVVILPTYQCNFRCEYCYESFQDIVMNNQTQNEVVAFITSELKKYESLNISWFGGEPLLEIDIILSLSRKFKELCKSVGKVYLADITTNGYLLTEEVFRKLLKANIRTFQITIDGLAPTHDKFRHLVSGRGTYDIIINNLKAIRDNVKSTMFQIVLRTNMTKELSNGIEGHLSFIEKEFLLDMRFRHVCRIAFAYKNENISNEILNDVSLINTAFSTLPKNLINTSNQDYFIETFRDFLKGSASVCYAGKKSSIVIDPNGKLMKCTVCFDDDRNIVGDVRNGITIEKFNKWVERPTDDKANERCNNCLIYPICLNVSCPYEHFSTLKKKIQYCDSKINDTKLYIATLSNDASMCECIDHYFHQ